MSNLVMTSKRLAILAAIALLALSGWGNVAVAEMAASQEMDQVAQNWLTYTVAQTGTWGGVTDPTLSASQDVIENGVLLGRYYQVKPLGFIMVASLKELTPVKAYSDESDLDITAAGGPALLLREVLAHRLSLFESAYGSLEIAEPREGEGLFGRKGRAQWDRLAVNTRVFRDRIDSKTLGTRDFVGPLLTAEWHQGDPYNQLCPIGNGGERTVVGCVATATAMIFHYYQWPDEGVGNHQYYWHGDGSAPGAILSAEFWDSYDWANMPDFCPAGDGCTQVQEYALRELNYEVGVAFEMDYGADGSGVAPSDLPDVMNAIRDHFLYKDQMSLEYRNGHLPPETNWYPLLKAEINAGRPAQYFIEGHSMVMDGWNEPDEYSLYYHMNYGWGGSQNMWYLLDDWYCPEEPCDSWYESAFIGIEPDKSVMFTADTCVGWTPFEAHFEGSSELTVTDWDWNFGDGGVADVQSPDHTYDSAGLFNVSLTVEDGRAQYSRTKQNYILALADSLVGDTTTYEEGMTDLELVIHGANTIPIYKMGIPVYYPGDISLVYDSFSTEGCRTDYFEEQVVTQNAPTTKKLFITLTTSLAETSPDLDPGAGPVLKVYFHFDGTPTEGDSTIIVLSGYVSGSTERDPWFYGDLSEHEVRTADALVTTVPPGCCVGIRGNVDGDAQEQIVIADLVYLVDYMFTGGLEPPCYEEADVNGDDAVPLNISDLVYLVDYMFTGGSDPKDCP